MTFLVAAVVNFSLDLAFQVSKIQAKSSRLLQENYPNGF